MFEAARQRHPTLMDMSRYTVCHEFRRCPRNRRATSHRGTFDGAVPQRPLVCAAWANVSSGSPSRRWVGLAMAVVLAISGGVAVLMLVRSSATVGFDTSATSEATSTDTAQRPATPLVAATPTSTPPPASSPPPATTGANSAAPTDTPKRVAAQPDVLDVSGLSFFIVGCADGTSCLKHYLSGGVIAPPTTRRLPYLSPAGNAGCTNDPAIEITEHFNYAQHPALAAPIAADIYWSYDGSPFSSKNFWKTWAMAGAGIMANDGYDTVYDQQIHASSNSATNPISLAFAVTWKDARGWHRVVSPTLYFFWRC